MQREYGTDHTGNGSERAAGTGIGFRATYQKRFEATTHVFNNGGGRHPMRIMRVGLPMEDAYPSHSEARQEEPAVITLQPEKRAPIHLTQKLLMQQYLSTWIFGGTRAHRRAACAPLPEVGNDSHQVA
ncbi:hypothetical protein TcCL_NonESM10829 [Trypanosoma cruzi]|nr:hypothetical protein TcCL_NonESM10829 [Trypanosoma cruzi]